MLNLLKWLQVSNIEASSNEANEKVTFPNYFLNYIGKIHWLRYLYFIYATLMLTVLVFIILYIYFLLY